MIESHRGAPISVGSLVESHEDDRGVGRLRELNESGALVEYFDHPGPEGSMLVKEAPSCLRRVVLAPQTRVHWQAGGTWEHGRVIDQFDDGSRVVVRSRKRDLMLPGEEVFVRWRARLSDASSLLGDLWVESRRFYDGRQQFVRAYLDRMSAYQGLTALSSASIEAHHHQVEAARQVLSDVTPRYLLADEVGLGKTIEAGLIIRQYLLDDRHRNALVVAPPALEIQWQEELETKFRIFAEFPGCCRVAGFPILDAPTAVIAPSLLIVDEAHRLSAPSSHPSRYEALRRLASDADAVLLLSATPLLQEPESLLRLLHLLAPEGHRLDDVDGFVHALETRDQIAILYGNLNEDGSPVFIRDAVTGLRSLLGHDAHLQRLLDDVDAALGADDRDGLVRGIRRARSHVSEAHRVYNRMIRTRRGVGLAEDFPVLGRSVPVEVTVADALTDVSLAYATWHEHVLARMETMVPEERRELALAAADVVAGLSTGGDGLGTAARERLGQSGAVGPDDEERSLLRQVEAASRDRSAHCPRIVTAIEHALAQLAEQGRVVIATGSEAVSEQLYEELLRRGVGQPVLRITEAVTGVVAKFERAEQGAVLVIGSVGEEGQNLQSAAVVIHLDLPWDPNRLEQRIGRFDRFGPGFAAQHVVLLDDADTAGNAWYQLLRDGFGIFSSSIASLQLRIERLVGPLREIGVSGGADGLRNQREWVARELEEELSAVQLAELLDETVMDDRGRRLMDSLDEAETAKVSTEWQNAVIRWAAGDNTGSADLRFYHAEEQSEHRFALTRFENPDVGRLRDVDLPLVSWHDLAEEFAGAMPDGVAIGTFRRATAWRRGLRLLGPGDPFVEALWNFTEFDDRGRAFAVWRAREYWRGRDEFLAVCMDVRIRPDIRPAIAVSDRDGRSAKSALRRRAESYLAPVTATVWLDFQGREITDEARLKILTAPHNENLGDKTLRVSMWHRVDEHVARADWKAWCATARDRAIEIVSKRHDLAERCQTAALQAQVDSEDAVARLAARADEASKNAEALERLVGAAVVEGLLRPTTEIDAAGVVILAGETLPDEPDP
jgi:ATP-dependent helicase HepA